MLAKPLTIARKEILDSLRDTRPLLSSLFYILMGPGLVFMVSVTRAGSDPSVVAGMMSIFMLLSSFVGGMNVSMDLFAGERERRSLLPLLMTPATRWHVVFGKWIAVACFSTVSVLINFAAYGLVLTSAHITMHRWSSAVLILVSGFLPLALLASAIELGISTICRTTKEAHTWLSMVVFIPMVLGISVVFFASAVGSWTRIVPVVGQQQQLEQWVRGDLSLGTHALLLGVMTIAMTAIALRIASKLLERDDVVYGN